MKTYKQFNESLRDKMKPKSDEDIKSALGDIDKISPFEKISKGIKHQVSWLVEQGFEESKPHIFSDDNLLSFLMNAVMTGDVEITKIILDNRGELDILGLSPGYALSGALDIGSIDMIKLLIEHGDNLDGIDGHMNKLYKMMEYDDRYDAVKFIIDNSPKIKKKVENYIKDAEEELIKIKRFVQ